MLREFPAAQAFASATVLVVEGDYAKAGTVAVAKVKLTKDEVAKLGRIAKGQEPADPRVLEQMADRLLQSSRSGRKLRLDYPWLTDRQRRSRIAKEVPLGGLIELVSTDPAARFHARVPVGASRCELSEDEAA